jgi:hypothetical protein
VYVCSFCNHVYHNTPTCIGKGNECVGGVESGGGTLSMPRMLEGDECTGVRRKLLGGQLKPRHKRKRKQRVEDRGE